MLRSTRSARWLGLALALASAFTLAACAADAMHAGASAAANNAAAVTSAIERPGLCDRAGDDKVRDVFCADDAARSSIRNLAALEESLGLHITPPSPDNKPDPFSYDPAGQNRVFVVMLSHSTSLAGRLVSELNPRVLVITDGTFLAFTRGVQQVEIAAQDRATQDFNFYLIELEQACNAASDGCSHSDLFSPRIESDWAKLQLRDAEELKNTPSDCRQCHQRGLDKPVLLMRELNGPWTHFFSRADDPAFPYPEPSGGNLMQDFLAAHGDEPYAGLRSDVLQTAHSFTLRNYVNIEQPLLFDGLKILRERWPNGNELEPMRSSTWDSAFEAFKRGEQLALPYFAPRASDPGKAQQLTAAYRSFVDDALELPDLGDIFPDDAQTRAEIGLQVEPDAEPAQALVQACGSCHSDVLDQSISRARFNIALGRLDQGERDSAIARLRAPAGSAAAMPPHEARQLDDAARARLIEYLQRAERSQADDAFLEDAAQRGMFSEPHL